MLPPWDALKRAEGMNPNSFFKTPEPFPVISGEAILNHPAIRPTTEYDLPTEAGKEYVFFAAGDLKN